MKKSPPRGLKIVQEGNVANNVRVFALVDGQELDFSSIVQKVDIKLHVGEVATANLQCIVYSVESDALLAEARIVETRPRFPWFGLRWREVTSFASRAREFVR